MATNENSTSQINNDNNSSSNNQNNNMIDMPLYTESKITRKQAIGEIADVILNSNMKPRTVKYALQLLKKLLPIDNTLPTTIDELFGAMLSSENDWRLAQYLIKHKQSPSFLPSSPNMSNENSDMPILATNSFSIQQESNIPIQPLSTLCLPFNSNESSSSSDDENELTSYDRLQQCLRPITDLSTDFNLNYTTSLHSNNIVSLDQRSRLSSSSNNTTTLLESFERTSSTISTNEYDLLYTRLFKRFEDDTDDEISCYSTTNENNKLCCFEINGCDLLNGGKRRRYY